MKVMNGERIIPRGGFRLTIPGLRGSDYNKRNRNEGGKWVIDRSLGDARFGFLTVTLAGEQLSERSALDEVYYNSSSSSTTTSASTISRNLEGEGVDEEKEQQNLPTWWIESPFLHINRWHR